MRTPDGRLRIVYVTEDTGVGGGHRDIFEHLNRLAARGHDAQLFSLGEHPDWFPLEVPTRTFEDYDDLVEALEPLEAIKVATWWNTGGPVWLRIGARAASPSSSSRTSRRATTPTTPTMQAHVIARATGRSSAT